MTAVKFCGIRRPEDLDFINQSQPDYIGFVFAPSRRQVTASQAAALANRLKVPISTVGVFVNEPLDSLCSIAKKSQIQVIQLHGEETEADIWELRKHLPHQKIWKAVRVQTSDDIRLADRLPVDALLLDSFVPGSYGGNGQTANWDLIRQTQIQKPFFLAGGLHTENIPQAIAAVHPYGIDLSGGIETDGWKDQRKMQAVLEAVRAADDTI